MNVRDSAFRPVERRSVSQLNDVVDGDVMLSVRVPADWKRDVKSYAAAHNVSLQSLVIDAISQYLR